ncbi:hypothetical protein O9X98_08170 [Agrobacterium salinitolerans]|nr:hypothetical protein [Agrobacterium salinitolerans]
MVPTANPFASIDLDENNHRYILCRGYDLTFLKSHTASVPSDADEAVVGNAMNRIARFKRGEDARWPWSELKDFLRGMEIAWDIGRRDMQKDFRALLGVKNND